MVLEGPGASCTHEDGEEVGVGGTHEVGEEAGVGGGGQQICIVEVTCVVWRWVVPLSDGRSSVRRFSNRQLEDPCGTSTFDEATRSMKTTVYVPTSRWMGSAR
jgi:hypothetical protein